MLGRFTCGSWDAVTFGIEPLFSDFPLLPVKLGGEFLRVPARAGTSNVKPFFCQRELGSFPVPVELGSLSLVWTSHQGLGVETDLRRQVRLWHLLQHRLWQVSTLDLKAVNSL